MTRLRSLLVVALVLASSLATRALATHDTAACADVTLVFARGSGQSLGEREAPEYFARLTDRLDGVTVNAYELGTEDHGGGRYPAVGITGSIQSYKNLLEAEWSWTGGAGGQYRDSVASGVTELTSFLAARAGRCPDEVFAVGGYSQGAETVGNALHELTVGVRSRIAHVALFGDPKLYLPEGRGPFPPACRGKEFSAWRRGNVSCWTDNGILEARRPYLPADIENRAGSWCDREDGICNGNIGDVVLGSSHGDYADEGAELDEAVHEAAVAIADAIPDKASAFDLVPLLLAVGTDGLDVALVIDTTGSMSGAIGAARATAQEIGDLVTSLGGRVALTEYRDAYDSFVARIRTPLTTDIDTYDAAVGSLFASGGGDTPEALLTALMTTFDGLAWRNGATKAAVVLTDASYHDPDVAEGWTLDDVVRRSLEIDPVNVYPVIPSYLTGFYGPLAERTAGQVILNTGDTAQALRNAFDSVTSRPVVSFALGDYVGAPGDEIVFTVDAYDVDADIDHFLWDLDGDGNTDLTTIEPSVGWTYPAPWSGIAEVRAVSTDGGLGSAATSVRIAAAGLAGELPGTPVNLSAGATDAGDGTRRVDLRWDPPLGGGPVTHWFVVNDEGTTVGVIPGDTFTHTIFGVPTRTVELSIVAANEFGTSDPASVTVHGGDRDPRSALEVLRADVRGADIDQGTARSLLASLDAAIAALDRDNLAAGCNNLAAFRSKLRSAAKERKLPVDLAMDWDSRAQLIGEQLDC